MRVVIGYPPLPDTEHLGRPQTAQNRQFQWFNEPTHIFPVIPAYAATMLKEAGHEVRFWDGPALGWTWTGYMYELRNFKPDIIAWEVKTPTVKRVWPLIDRVKLWLPSATVVLIGDHITALPQESLDNCAVDVCLTGGDYDYGLKAIVDSRASGGLKRGIWAQDTNSDLTTLPLIDRELVRWRSYAYHNGNFKYTPGTYTMAGRDCWWRNNGGCTFCSWTTTFKNFRVCTVDQFMAEIENCASLGIREVFDDTGTFPVGRWLYDACEALKKFNKGLRHGKSRITVGCNMRPGALSRDQYDHLGAAGFRFILYGLESASHRTLERINKGQAADDMRNTARMAKRAGLEPHVTCMVGYPWESREEAEQTISLTRELFIRGDIDTLQATVIIPYPGTQLFQEAQEKGWLKYGTDWNLYDMRRPVMTCPMTDEEVLSMTRGIYTSCITPRFILRKLLTVRNRYDLQYLYRGIRYVMGHLTDFAPHNRAKRKSSARDVGNVGGC